jgi:hypothetical protein
MDLGRLICWNTSKPTNLIFFRFSIERNFTYPPKNEKKYLDTLRLINQAGGIWNNSVQQGHELS